MIFGTRKPKAIETEKIKIWIKRVTRKGVIKSGLFYRHNFIFRTLGGTQGSENPASYEGMKDCLMGQGYLKWETEVVAFTSDQGHTIYVNNDMQFDNLFFQLDEELSTEIHLLIMGVKDEQVIESDHHHHWREKKQTSQYWKKSYSFDEMMTACNSLISTT